MKLGDLMNYTKMLGILLIILGVLFIACPLASAGVVSIMAGVTLISFGLVVMFNAFTLWSIASGRSIIELIMGFLLILLGFLFFVDLAPLAFLTAYNFYLIAIILIVLGILGIIYGEGTLKWGSALVLLFGIIFFIMGILSISNPLFIVILIGVCLIVRGVIFLTLGGAMDTIEKFENN